jgi:hypothetical protein
MNKKRHDLGLAIEPDQEDKNSGEIETPPYPVP